MRLSCLLIAACLSMFAPPSMAAPADPLWLAAREALLASRALVAGEVEAQIVVLDEDGKNLDTVRKTTQLSGWRNGEPVRSTVKLTETQKSGLGELKIGWGIADHPEQALPDADSVVRVGPAQLDGKACMLFQASGTQRKRPFTARVWIDEAARLPLRADYTLTGIPMTKSMRYSVLFGRDAQARWLPLAIDIDATMSALFTSFRIQSAQRLSNWVPRP